MFETFATFKVTHSMRHTARLLSMGFSPLGLARVVGTSNGSMHIGKKKWKCIHNENTEIDNEFSASHP